jgi:hypothetical protein
LCVKNIYALDCAARCHAQTLNKSLFWCGVPSGAKAHVVRGVFAARLKSCPDPKRVAVFAARDLRTAWVPRSSPDPKRVAVFAARDLRTAAWVPRSSPDPKRVAVFAARAKVLEGTGPSA